MELKLTISTCCVRERKREKGDAGQRVLGEIQGLITELRSRVSRNCPRQQSRYLNTGEGRKCKTSLQDATV